MALQKTLLSLITLILLPGAIAFAQQPQNPASEGEKTKLSKPRDLHGKHIRGGPGVRRWGRDLNLTEEQQQQLRAILQRRREATKSQREELIALREKRRAGTLAAEDEARLQTLRQELHDSMKGIHAEISTILTSEQRAKIEAREQERKSRPELKLRNREESPNKN